MSSKLARVLSSFALGCASVTAMAGPVDVDGVIGAEWAGIAGVNVAYNPGAPSGNFSAGSNITLGASYNIKVRDDGNYFYVALSITGDADKSIGNFANLYFDTDPQNNNGSDVGFEVTNNRYFIAGVTDTWYDASAWLTYDNLSHPGVIELAIANDFFTSGPRAGLDYPDGYPVATGDVVLRLSQSFGYSVAGGATYGDTRLGRASVLAAEVPEPESLALMLAGLGALGLTLRRRKQVPLQAA